MDFETILYEEDGPIGWLTLNRPDDGNMFTAQMCHELRDCIDAIRRETRTRVLVITGAGEKFFCLGGRKEGMEDTRLYAGVLPTLEIYESIDRLRDETRAWALEVAERGAVALASIKAAFNARHGGVAGLARVAHDLLLRQYLDSEESKELGAAFAERRKPDPDKFGH